MAFRTWLKLLQATLGVGALAGASQLGMAYGLGIVRLTRVLDVTTRDQWTAQLAWVAWFAMVAAVVGALAGAWLMPRWNPALRPPPALADPASPGPSGAGTWPTSVNVARRPAPPAPGVGTMIALASAAAIGAGVVAPLTMQPARTAQIAGVNAVVVIGICASLGAIVGLFAAYAALAQAVARWNLLTVAIAVWVVALISVSPSLAVSPSHASSDPLPAIRLGVFDAGFLSPAITQRTALFTMPAIALLAGAVLGWRARRQERPTVTIALAGLPGAALLTLAYLIAGPGAGADRYQVVPYWAAMTAAGAGVLGSVLAAVLRRSSDLDADDDSDDPTPGRPPLPRSTNQPEPATAAAPASSTAASASATTAQVGGEDRSAGKPNAFDASSGQARPAPSGQNPLAAPWSPAAGGASAPLAPPGGGRPGTVEAFVARPGAPATSRPSPAAPGHLGGRPGSVALGEYTDQEPPAFDGFARGSSKQSRTAGRAQHAAPEQTAVHDNFAAKPYVPEPATRPLPPEVLSPPARGGALSRGLRSLGRSRPSGTAPVDLPLPSAHDRPDPGARDSQPEPKRGRRSRRGPLVPEPEAISAPLPQPTPSAPPPWHHEPTQAHRTGPAPAVQRNEATAKGGQLDFGRPAPASDAAPGFGRTPQAPDAAGFGRTAPGSRAAGDRRVETGDTAHGGRSDAAAPSTGRHSEASAKPPAEGDVDGKKGRRFGLKKRKESNDYVDWVSGLGND